MVTLPQATFRAIAVVAVLATVGCAPISTESEMRAHDSLSIDPANPRRINFVVNGDPGLAKYPQINAMPMPMHERIREGMRRQAADVLADRGLCSKGFLGPDKVWSYERARLTRHFTVECKE